MAARRWTPSLLVAVVLLGAVIAHAQTADESLRQWRRKRPRVARIEVSGNRVLNAGHIRGLMLIHGPGFWTHLGLRRPPPLAIGAEAHDAEAIRVAYRQAGYWDAHVDITVRPDSLNQAVVAVQVQEGRPYRWGQFSLEGDDANLVTRSARITRSLKTGGTADSLGLAAVIARITADCADRGHPEAAATPTIRARTDTLDVDLRLRSGPPVIFGSLSIAGAAVTHEDVIRREVGWDSGAGSSQKKMGWQQQDVYNTGLFTFVHLEPARFDTASIPGTRIADFRLRVVERKPSYIGFQTGAGQDPDRDLTWDYSFEWGSRNWRGTGRQWSLSAKSGFVVVTDWRVLHHRFALSYMEPWPLGVHLPTTLTLAYEPGLRSPTQNYRVETFSGELTTTQRIGRVMRWSSSLVYERVTIYGVPIEQQAALLEEEGINIRRRWTGVLERDTRPNLFVPTSGAHTRIEGEYVGGILGGANDFYKLDISWARYQIVSSPTVLATRFRIAWANTHSGGTFIPTIDLFYLGGANSIRGYAENTVGPVDSLGQPTGGRVVTLGNAELRTPVFTKLWFTLFMDAGNDFAEFRQVALGDMLVSMGIGWEYLAPVGPIRLDYARRVVHPHYPKSDRLHLSILFSF